MAAGNGRVPGAAGSDEELVSVLFLWSADHSGVRNGALVDGHPLHVSGREGFPWRGIEMEAVVFLWLLLR